MIKRILVLVAVLLGALSSIGHAETRTILFKGTVTGRFPICSFQFPGGTQSFYFFPAQLQNGSEGVWVTWSSPKGSVGGTAPLSAVKITQNNPQRFKLVFSFDVNHMSTDFKFGDPTTLKGSCEQVSQDPLAKWNLWTSNGTHGTTTQVTAQRPCSPPPVPGGNPVCQDSGPYQETIFTGAGSTTSSSAVVGKDGTGASATINEEKIQLDPGTLPYAGSLQRNAGQATFQINLVQP